MKIKPLDDRVVIEPLEGEDKSAGGIVLPDTAKKKPQRGKVVAVGPGRPLEGGKRAPMNVKVGDEVLYGEFSGDEYSVEGNDYLIMKESDILAKVV